MKKRLSEKNASGGREAIIPLDEYSVVNVGGLVLVFISFWIKLNNEEEVMRKQFPDQYTAYEEHVKRIIPFIL
jgi:protein-S-isoprenylcysteine O-methyltransferase Ste14